MANDLIGHAEWMKRTALLLKPRSPQLVALDQALERYEKFGGGDARWRVEQALTAWQRSKGPGDAWKLNDRNRKDRAFEHLTALLAGGDSDTLATGTPEFMHPALIHARLGVIYLFGHTKVSSNIFGLVLEGGLGVVNGVLGFQGAAIDSGGLGKEAASIAQTNLAAAMVPGNQLLGAIESSTYAARSKEQATLLERARSWFADFIRKAWDTIKEKFGDVDVTYAAIKNLVNACAGAFASAAAPFVSAGMDIAKGVVNTLDAAIDRFRAWRDSRGVELLQGHPTVIVEALKRAMTLGIFEGLYQTLKGATSAAITAFTAGGQLIVNILVALCEMIFKLIWRVIEIARMKVFFKEAAAHWQTRDNPDAIHRRPFAFGSWYKDTVSRLPCLAALTLNSGICGDKMHFLQMFKADRTLVSSDDFQRGAAFVDGLKAYGSDYLGKCAYQFQSDDDVVASLLKFAGQHGGQGNVIWRHVVKLANA